MLIELSMADFGVVSQSRIELGAGMIALTGETGAGKTMIIAGLGHLLGQRADAGIVRHGADKAVVRGRWQVDDAVAERVTQLGGVVEDGELVTVRQVAAGGRSRAVVGASPAPVAVLQELELATIHGQSEQQRLGTQPRQRELLDRCARPRGMARYRQAWREREAAGRELAELERSSRERAREADMLRFGLAEISAAAPESGEDVRLVAEQRRLLDLDELRLSASHAHNRISGDDTDFDQPCAVSLVGDARKALERLADRDPAAAELLVRAHEADLAVQTLAADVSGYLADLVADPLRLEAVSARLAELAHLTRKYGATIDEVLTWAAEATQRLIVLDSSDERITELRELVTTLDAELGELARGITAARERAAAELAERVHAELAALAMPHARLAFVVSAGELGPHGADRVELMFAANPGTELAPLRKVASGGELSRVRLALEVVLAEAGGHTFVFDEVDAGVGGAVGLEIGKRLQRLASGAQVIVVTHLAQVAAYADQHFVVRKSDDGAVTVSDVREVSGKERVAELARMMSGGDTPAARKHAAELLAGAGRG